MLIASPSQTESVSRPKATSPAARATYQAIGSVGVMRALTSTRDCASGGRPSANGSPSCGTNERRDVAGWPATCARASATAEMASAVACASASAASGATTVTASGPGSAGRAGRRVDQVVERAVRGRSAGRRGRTSRRRPSRAAGPPMRVPGRRGSATAIRHGPPSGGLPPEGEVAAEVDERAGQRRATPRASRRARVRRRSPCRCRPGRRRRPRSMRREPRRRVDLDRRAGAPAGRDARRSFVELLEGAVVAGGDERGEDRRIEAPARRLPRAHGERGAPRRAARRRRPSAPACSVQAREVARAGSKRESTASQAATSARAAASARCARRRSRSAVR